MYIRALLIPLLLYVLAGCSRQEDKSASAAAGEQLTSSGASEAELTRTQDEDPRYRWDLSAIYPQIPAWQADKILLEGQLEKLRACAGHVGESAQTLAHCLDLYAQTQKRLARLVDYAMMHADQDTRDSQALALKQSAQSLAAQATAAGSFIAPELLALAPDKLQAMLVNASELKDYHHFIDDILRRKPHTLTPEGEHIVAMTGVMGEMPGSLYSVFTNADMPWPTITLADGQRIRLDQSGYSLARQSANRDDRKHVFDAFWGIWKQYEHTLGLAYYSQLQRDHFYAEVRHYPNSLTAELDDPNIPPQVYQTLVAQVDAGLPVLHRYFKLRARMLGLTQMAYYDIYPPLVQWERSYPLNQAEQLAIQATQVLGHEYTAVLQQGFDGHWMDVYPRPGKQSGAYMVGTVYDVHPFVLMNYNDDFESVSTLAHEWGHALHSHLANHNQSFLNAQYPTFVAEVASIVNELLLSDYLIQHARDDHERLYYLGMALENLRGTFFRQTMFAEFEQTVHARVDAGEALTGADFTRIYGDLLKRYHGHDQGVVHIDDRYAIEWAYIPHFYQSFYVYQYATSIAAAAQFVKQIEQGDAQARERYLNLLRAGGSEYGYELLRQAGVDMANPQPYQALLERMSAIMDQIEAILARKPATS